MSQSKPARVDIDLNDLRFLYYSLDATVNCDWLDADTYIALEAAQCTALAIVSRSLGVELAPQRAHAHVAVTAPLDLPPPKGAETNPLIPVRAVQGDHDRLPLAGVVYGISERFASFAFLNEVEADALVGEIAQLQACRILGELRTLVPTLVYTHSPIHIDEDDYPYLADSEPVDLTDCESWPPMPTQYALDLLPREVLEDLCEDAGAEEVWTTLDGNYLHVPLDREAELLAVLDRHGISARRDDALIEGLGE